MRISTIAYILKQGFKNIWSNLRFSLASIATMSACIFLFGLFLSLLMNFRYIVHSAEEGVAVIVYFENGTKQEQIDQIGSQIEKRAEVSKMEYISADEAWEEYKDIYLEGEDEDIADGFKDQDNPLANSARYNVYLKNVEKQSDLVKYIEGLDGVRKVEHSKQAADTLSSFNKLIAYVSVINYSDFTCSSLFPYQQYHYHGYFHPSGRNWYYEAHWCYRLFRKVTICPGGYFVRRNWSSTSSGCPLCHV